MATIVQRWLKLRDQIIDLSKVEHIVLTRAFTPETDAEWRKAVGAMITFDVENRHYVVSYDTDAEAESDFKSLWESL